MNKAAAEESVKFEKAEAKKKSDASKAANLKDRIKSQNKHTGHFPAKGGE